MLCFSNVQSTYTVSIFMVTELVQVHMKEVCHLYRKVEGIWPVSTTEGRRQYRSCSLSQWELGNPKTASAIWRCENGLTSGMWTVA